MVRPLLFDDSAREEKWIVAGQNRSPSFPDFQSDAAGYVFEAASFVFDVVGAACGFDVLIIGSAFEHKMPFREDVGCV